MITREDYLKALEIVDQYNRQLNESDLKPTQKTKISDWIQDKILTAGLHDVLMGYTISICSKKMFYYVEDINERDFMNIPNASETKWFELHKLLVESKFTVRNY